MSIVHFHISETIVHPESRNPIILADSLVDVHALRRLALMGIDNVKCVAIIGDTVADVFLARDRLFPPEPLRFPPIV